MAAIELLAPAKDLETGLAAIDCGADAVYIGAPRFGAREAAANSLAHIEQLAAYAHRVWAKVYAAVNTLLFDDEIDEAVELCHGLYRAGVDALIIQDAGLLACDLPPLPLIASTQMHNHSPARVAFLEKVGFGRAILARELDLRQIQAIRAATTIELEVFVHGALCVSMSGQCALSYALGGRSANRGQCAQPCRRGYALLDGHGQILERHRHLLSLRDLNLTSHLGDLLDAGVSSFKIEGRLKNKAYVMNVVGHYRQALDLCMADKGLRRSSSGRSRLGFVPNLDKTFNRGYTSYFLGGPGTAMASPDSPKHVGEPVGRVAAVQGDGFLLEGSVDLHPGDGITFFARHNTLAGSLVNCVEGKRIVAQSLAGLAPGARVFRNHDHAFAAEIAKSRPRRTIAIDLRLGETEDALVLEATDEDGVRARAAVACARIAADRPERAAAAAAEQLAKLGDTELEAKSVVLAWKPPLHVPIRVLNGLRRALVEELRKARLEARPVDRPRAADPAARFPEDRLSFLGNVLNAKAAAFYRRHGVTAIEPAAESGLDLRGRQVMIARYCLRRERGLCPREGATEDATLPWLLVDDRGRRLRLAFRCERRDCAMEIVLEG